jgi:hypothetical protein
MLTRHFYELETVAYALLDCLRYKKEEEAVFWAREIILSHEDETLSITVVKAWIMYMGAARVDWLDAWFLVDDSDVGGCQRLVLIVEFCRRTCNEKRLWLPFWIAVRGLSPVSDDDRVSIAIAENDPICLYWWLGQQYEKKPSTLVSKLCEFVDCPELFDGIKKGLALKLGLHLKTLLAVCAVQVLCLLEYPDRFVASESAGAFVAKLLGSWSTGLRSSRLFPIRSEQLPRGYKRVLQADTLCESAVKVMSSGCKFWQLIGALIKDDDTLESVTSEYFPNDIPDEWSIADRSLSHPVALDIYKVTMKPEYRIKLVWSCRYLPVIRRSWYPDMKLLFKACDAPDR